MQWRTSCGGSHARPATGHPATVPTAGPGPMWAPESSGQKWPPARDRIAGSLPPGLGPRTDPGHRERVARLMIPQAGHLPKRPTWNVTNPGSSSVRPQDVGRSADRTANQLRAAGADANLDGTARSRAQRGLSGRLAPRTAARRCFPTVRQSLAGDLSRRCCHGPGRTLRGPSQSNPTTTVVPRDTVVRRDDDSGASSS
jgi:hypothetical protein